MTVLIYVAFPLSWFADPVKTARIHKIPERIISGFGRLLNMMTSNSFVDLEEYEKTAMHVFYFWMDVRFSFVNFFTLVQDMSKYKNMTANQHLLLAHGAAYIRYISSSTSLQ